MERAMHHVRGRHKHGAFSAAHSAVTPNDAGTNRMAEEAGSIFAMTAPIQTDWKALIDDMRGRLDSLESMLTNSRQVESPNEMEIITRVFAKSFGVKYDDLMAIKKTGRLSRARHACCWAIKTLCPDISQVEIGLFMNDRHHGCINNSLKRAQSLMETEPSFLLRSQDALGFARAELTRRKILVD